MHHRTSIGLITALLLAAVGLTRAAGIELTAGVAAADITPDTRMLNWTLPQARPYGEVHDPLFARAVVLSDGETRVALLAWDLLDAREFAVARIRTAITAATGIPSAHVLISATHNHSGPKSEMGTSRASAREERTSRPAQREAMFLQGCAGDVVPARRGLEAVEQMADLISQRAVAAWKVAATLTPAGLRVAQAVIGLPATPAAASDMQRRAIDSEVQVISCGELALVTLPGEPLQDLAHAIQARSIFPHTLVLGNANGRGVGYVGLPGNKVKGGYEMSEVGHGTDEAGGFLGATAVRLLDELASGESRLAK